MFGFTATPGVRDLPAVLLSALVGQADELNLFTELLHLVLDRGIRPGPFGAEVTGLMTIRSKLSPDCSKGEAGKEQKPLSQASTVCWVMVEGRKESRAPARGLMAR